MKLTLHADDLLRFRHLVSTLTAGPRGFYLHVIEYRKKLALALGGSDWQLVMPIRGRKPVRPFQIPFAPVHSIRATVQGKILIRTRPEKGIGRIEWHESGGWKASQTFRFGLAEYVTCRLPPEPSESQTYPKALLTALSKCSRICSGSRSSALAGVRLTPNGEIGVTDGKRMLLQKTEFRFPGSENFLVRASDLYRQTDRENFSLGAIDGWVRFDFGEFFFWTRPDVDRYPDLHRILPKDDEIRTRLTIHPQDAVFLKKHLTKRKSEITLFCGYDGIVSVTRPEMPALVPVRSGYEGDAMVLTTKQGDLLEALSHECFEFRCGEKHPAAFGPKATYCWVPIEMSFLPLDSEFPPKPSGILPSTG